MRNDELNRLLNRTNGAVASATLLVFLFGSLWSGATAQTAQESGIKLTGDHSASGHSLKPNATVPNVIPDVEALDQDNKPLHFYSDLIKGKTVLLNFVFTSCTYICPRQGANFSKLQAILSDRLGKDVYLISVSIDPLTDTPQKLKSWGDRFGARAGWTLVTGKKAEIDRILVALTGNASGLLEHTAIAFMGDYDRGVWIGADPLDDPARLLKTLDAAVHPKHDH